MLTAGACVSLASAIGSLCLRPRLPPTPPTQPFSLLFESSALTAGLLSQNEDEVHRQREPAVQPLPPEPA